MVAARPFFIGRQARLRAVERLDLALLVDAQHHRLVRRVQVEPHDIDDFLLEVRIVRDLELGRAMWLQARLAPDAPNTRRADADGLRHRRSAPVRGIARGFARCLLDDRELHRVRQRRHARGTRLVVQQTIDTFVDVAHLPPPNARLRLPREPHDFVGAVTRRRCQHDLGAPHGLARAVAILDDRIEPGMVRRAHVEADVIASHAPHND